MLNYSVIAVKPASVQTGKRSVKLMRSPCLEVTDTYTRYGVVVTINEAATKFARL